MSLILFGQQDTLLAIKPPFRYIEKGDTFSVFRLRDERIIVFKLAQGKDCESNFEKAKNVIAEADTTIFSKNEQIDDLKQQRENLTAQVANDEKIISSHKKESAEDKKSIKKLERTNKVLKITTGISSLIALILIIIK